MAAIAAVWDGAGHSSDSTSWAFFSTELQSGLGKAHSHREALLHRWIRAKTVHYPLTGREGNVFDDARLCVGGLAQPLLFPRWLRGEGGRHVRVTKNAGEATHSVGQILLNVTSPAELYRALAFDLIPGRRALPYKVRELLPSSQLQHSRLVRCHAAVTNVKAEEVAEVLQLWPMRILVLRKLCWLLLT